MRPQPIFSQIAAYLCFSYGVQVLSERQCRNWFEKFKKGNFEVNNASGQGRKMTLDLDQLRSLLQENPRQSTNELAIILNVCQKTISNGLKKLEFVHKRGTWVPHELSEINKNQRISIARLLFQRNEIEPFLHRLVTCDEKWVLYNNITNKKQWLPKGQDPIPTAKADLHPKKILLSVFWDYKGVIHYELLPNGQTIDAQVYCAQLDRLAEKILEKRPSLANRKGVIFHQDNARPHTASLTRNKINNDLKWELIPHPPYSPDLAPSDFHLFRSMEHYLRNKKYANRSDLDSGLMNFFNSKDPNFYRRGIYNLVNRWQRIIDGNGAYLI